MRGNTENNDQNRKTTSTRDNDINIAKVIIVKVSSVVQCHKALASKPNRAIASSMPSWGLHSVLFARAVSIGW